MCVLFLSSFCVVLSSLLFPLCVFVCYVSVSIGSVVCVCSVSWSIVPVCLCSLLCLLLGLCLLYCVSVCYPFLSMCSLMCVYCMCLIYVWRVSVIGLCVCACVLLTVSVCTVYCVSVCLCLLFLCMYVVYVSTVFYVYCICYVYVCFSVLVLCLCCWLPCWCGVYHGGVMGACFLGLVVLVFWGVWRVWNFFIFYSRFGVGGRLLLGFCYRTFFCGFPWGLCHTRNFFKDITHSYCGYVAPVMSLCMCLLAYLYHTRYCADIAPVYTCAPCLPLPVFVSACVYVTPVFHSVLPRYCAYSTPCLVSACACSMSCVTFRIGCRCLVLGRCAVWGMLFVVVCFTCWFYTPFFLCLFVLLEGL